MSETLDLSRLKTPSGLEFQAEGHRYLYNGKLVPSVTTILQDLRIVDFENVPKEALEFGQQRGTYVHQAIEMWLNEVLDEAQLDDQLKPYLESFKKLWHTMEFETIAMEIPLMDTIAGVAGTPDWVGKVNGKFAVMDFKAWSSINKMGRLALRYQTAAYSKMVNLALLGEGCLQVALWRYGVHLKKDGSMAELILLDNPADRYLWESAVAVYMSKEK